jgi:hypothetical protein
MSLLKHMQGSTMLVYTFKALRALVYLRLQSTSCHVKDMLLRAANYSTDQTCYFDDHSVLC